MNPGQTDISDILFNDCDSTLKNDKFNATGVTGLKFENVIVNGKPYSASPIPPTGERSSRSFSKSRFTADVR
jgi:hypothetical protein